MFFIFLSVVKHDGCARSFCDGGDSGMGCTSREAGASRSKTWQNHSQDKLLTCPHKPCWSLSNLRTRSHGYLKLDIPTRRSCASWSINSSPRRPSCVRIILRSSCKSTNRRGGESIDATGDGCLARKLHRGRVTRDAGSIAYLEYRGRGEFSPPVRRKFIRFLVSSYKNSEPTRMRVSGNRRQYQLAPARSPE